jgi:transcriptional regulator with XRE-family HTH domain
MSIGARFKQLRDKNKLTQEKVGEFVGVTKGMISQWENNTVTPPIDRLLELKKHIDFSFDWLLEGEIGIAAKIEMQLGVQERRAWYKVGNSLAEPDEGTNGNQ